jgi:hypothetical protein
MHHEEAFVRAFILPEKQARYLKLLKDPKRRGDILGRLNHHVDYDPSLATEVAGADAYVENLERVLRSKGAPDVCHVMGGPTEVGWSGGCIDGGVGCRFVS